MISTGDVQGCLRKLETLLRVIKYPGCVDYSGLSKGDPSAFLHIVSFTLTSFSPPFAEELMAAGLELTGKTDLRFTETLYKVLRDIFHYKPILTKQQFLQWGFSQRKISFICDVINLVLQKHNQLKKLRIRCLALRQHGKGEAYPTLTDGDTVSERLIDVSGTRNPPAFLTNSSYTEAFSSDNVTCFSLNEVHSSASPEIGLTDQAGVDEDKNNILQTSICQSSDLEERLSALEAQLKSLQSRLDGLSTLEKPLEEVERKKNTDKNDGQVITICRESWENLISRVLLLETKLALSNTQLTFPVACLSCTSAHSFGSMSDTSKDDFKGKLESITNILRSTSSLLKNTEYDATSDK